MTQPELDFVDVELGGDMRLFIDPYALRTRADPLSVACVEDIRVFFQRLLDALREHDLDEARRLLGNLHEPNETRLGYSTDEARGSGIGRGLADGIIEALVTSRAIQTGFIHDISDTELLIDGIGPDKVSDLSTNIIRRHLVDYTQSQCELHKVPLVRVPAGPLWDPETLAWRDDYTQLPVAQGDRILLVPKSIVRWRGELNPREYFDDYVIHFLRQQELANPASELGRLVRGERRIRKKDLEQKYGKGSKSFLLEFSQNHPAVLQKYKEQKGLAGPLTPTELEEDFDPVAFAPILASRLEEIPPGAEHATAYHKFMVGLLSFLFYPNLLHPKVEAEINEGRKRIDILYENGAHSGVFERFTRTLRMPSMFISVECKNYTREVANPEIDQLIGRFANHRGRLGILICRRLEDRNLLVARCRDTAAAGLGFILPLDDQNVLAMLRHVEHRDYNAVDGHLSELLHQVSA
jgi:hypothetical protein